MREDIRWFLEQDNAVAIVAVISGLLAIWGLVLIVRMFNKDKTDDTLLEVTRILGNTLTESNNKSSANQTRILELQEKQQQFIADSEERMTKFLFELRDDMRTRLQQHDSAAMNRNTETIQAFQEATDAIALIPASLQSITNDINKNHTAIKAIQTGQQSTDAQIEGIKQSVHRMISKVDDNTILEHLLAAVTSLSTDVKTAIAKRTTATIPSPFTTPLADPILRPPLKPKPPTPPPSP